MNLRKTAKIINAELFDNSLDLENVHFKKLHFLESHGVSWIQFDGIIEIHGITLKMEANDIDIFVGICENCMPLKTFDILVHELIHVWQLQNDRAMDHGKGFHKWCEKGIDVFYN